MAIPLILASALGVAISALVFWPKPEAGKTRPGEYPSPTMTIAADDLPPANSAGTMPKPPLRSGERAASARKNTGTKTSCEEIADPAVERKLAEGLSAVRAGQLDRGAGDLEAARSNLPPCRLKYIDPVLSDTLTKLGAQAIKRELWAEAASRLERAVALAPDSAAPRYGLGQIAEKQGDVARARREYREAARLGPDEKTIQRLFELAYAANELEEAAGWLKKLIPITDGANRKKWTELAARLGRERPVEETMQSRVDERFQIMYDGRENADAAFAAQSALVDAFMALTRELKARPAGPVSVILYTKEQFYDVTRAPSWSGGVYDGKIRIPVGGVTRNGGPALRRVVFHELVHVLVRERTGQNVPTWLNEGLAVYYEGLASGGVNGGGGSWNVKTLRVLEAPFTRLPNKLVHPAYEKSREAVAHIVAQKGENSLVYLLDALASGAKLEAALRGIGMQYTE